QKISIPFKNEETALKIEENISDFALLFLFDVQSGVEQGVLCKTKGVYFMNGITGDVYSIK
ncbi:MAG: hypothetical protein LBH90_07515, partial [Tannerella sp.]|nr:hypothetical protein [Tannerella sp.]